MKAKYFWIVMSIQALVIVALLFVMVPRLSVGLIQNHCEGCDTVSAIAVAAQIGRLDIVSFCLAFLGIGVGFFAIFSFFAIKEDAEEVARKTVEAEFEDRWRNLSRRNSDQIGSLFRAFQASQGANYSIDDVDTSNREVEDDY